MFLSLSTADKAPQIKKNPKDVVAIADFPFGGDKSITGNVLFTAKNGSAVNVHFDMTGFPATGGPFYFHIHESPVPLNRDCEQVGNHFNPYNAPPDCIKQRDDSYCQVGDFLGKHGFVNSTCFELQFQDPYLSLNKKSKSYIVGRSLVFHYENMTKLACADIELADQLKIQHLINEYTRTGDYAQLRELEAPLEVDYVFDEAAGLLSEVFEEIPPHAFNVGGDLLANEAILNGVNGTGKVNDNLSNSSNFTNGIKNNNNQTKELVSRPPLNLTKNETNFAIKDTSVSSRENSSPMICYREVICLVILAMIAALVVI